MLGADARLAVAEHDERAVAGELRAAASAAPPRRGRRGRSAADGRAAARRGAPAPAGSSSIARSAGAVRAGGKDQELARGAQRRQPGVQGATVASRPSGQDREVEGRRPGLGVPPAEPEAVDVALTRPRPRSRRRRAGRPRPRGRAGPRAGPAPPARPRAAPAGAVGRAAGWRRARPQSGRRGPGRRGRGGRDGDAGQSPVRPSPLAAATSRPARCAETTGRVCGIPPARRDRDPGILGA